ncbi:MAG: benzoate-CoA ligase family protein [Alphaproteobacteria bacterium]|nr:benzoate-CoA ligase family protein [Alphaproteobacteria bacterium]
MGGSGDTFVLDNLPRRDLWPDMDFGGLPDLAAYPARLNCAVEFIDRAVAAGHADRPALRFGDAIWTYAELMDKVGRIARVLAEDMGVRPGNRVLLRGPNNPMMVAAWFAVARIGAVVVATMPLLRAKELAYIVEKAQIEYCLCDASLAEEVDLTCKQAKTLKRVVLFSATGAAGAELDRAMSNGAGKRDAHDSAVDDPVLIAFTSGTTGKPKGTVHFHRDMLASCDTFARHVAKVRPDDIFAGSPPLAFTFGLGALVLFPMRFGASSVLVEKFGPTTLLETVQKHRVTGIYTAPTGYRTMLEHVRRFDLSSLRLCVSAGEHLPKATWEAWRAATGLGIVDGIGSTEMLHIFISAAGDDIRPGATGRAVPGYQARIVDERGEPIAVGEQGWLAVKGPTGCRYLDDADRQRAYVKKGWNITGDVYRQDEDGYFWYIARGDDMIISAGYNISGPEVENCLLAHPKVAECAVVSAPDEERGQIVKAYVVLRAGADDSAETAKELQDYVKAAIAPYKYPRAVEFRKELPKTQTGKLQRFRLRQEATGEKI